MQAILPILSPRKEAKLMKPWQKILFRILLSLSSATAYGMSVNSLSYSQQSSIRFVTPVSLELKSHLP